MARGKSTSANAATTDATIAQPPTSMATVFVETTLGTRLAMLVSPDDTVALVKRKLAAEHSLCFPYIGEVNIQAIKVKRRAFFYHLSDAMILRSAFDGIRWTWFLYVDAEAIDPDKQISRAANISADEKGKNFSLDGPSSPNIEKKETTSLPNSHHGRLLSGETLTKKAGNQENGVHNVFERNSSEVNRSDPPSYEMQIQTSKNNDAVEVQDKSNLDAEGTTGVASVAVKKEKCKKRGNVCQDISTMENLPKESFAQNKKHKAKDGSATSGSPAAETANLHTEEITEDGPLEEFMGLSESKRSLQTNCDSSLPSSPMSDKTKTKRKKQSYKLLGNIESPDSGAVFASAGNRKKMDKTETTEFIGDRAIHKISAEPVQNTNVIMRKVSHAGNDGDVGADKVDIHPDDACDIHDLVIHRTTVAEDAVHDNNFEKADVDNLVVGDAGKKHRRKKKNLGKSALKNNLLEQCQIIGDHATKGNQQIGHVGDHTDLNNVSDGAALPGETTTTQRLVDADYAISVKSKDGQSRRRKEKATKNKVVSEEEHSKESKSLENHDKYTDLQPPSVVDQVSPHNIPDGNVGYLIQHLPTGGENNEDELSKKAEILQESLSFERTLLVDSAVPTRPIDKKPRRSRKKSAKSSELLNSDDNEAESLHLNVENTRVPMGNHNSDKHKVYEQAPVPSKVGVSTSNPTAYAMQVNYSSGKEVVLDNHKNSSKMSVESVVTGEAQALPKPIATSSIQPNDQKSRRSKKQSAQLKLLDGESMQSEIDYSVGKELLQNSKGLSEEAENANFGEESQSANTRREESAFQGPIKENSTELLSISQADSQIALGKLDHKTDNRKRKQSKKSKKPNLSEEALNYVNPRREKATKQLQEGSQNPTESIVPLGKEAFEENGESTHENIETGIATAVDTAIASIDPPTGNNLSLDMNDVELPPGSEKIIRNVDEADGPFPGSETMPAVDNTGQEDTEPVVQEALVDSVGGKAFAPLDADSRKQPSGKTKKKRRKSDRQEEEYHKMSLGEKNSNDVVNYGLSGTMERPNSKVQDFSCMETDIEEQNNHKARRRKSRSDAHAKNSSQEQNKLLEKPSDSDLVSPGLNNHVELRAGEECRSKKYDQATLAGTTNSKGQDGIANNCDLDSPRKSHKSCYSENELDDDSAVHKKSESIDNQSKVMHKAETKPLLPENDQNHHSSGRRVAPRKGFVDEHVASNESTEEETPMLKDRYRLAVRKVPHRRIAQVLENSKQKKTITASSGAIFDDSACGISDEELVLNSRKGAAESASTNSFASDDSDSESDETSITSLKNRSSTKTPQNYGFWSNARGNENKEIHSGDGALTQSNTGKRSLGAILKGTSSYKKAKLSQSQNEDADSQPDDVVLETQPDYFSS